MTAEDAKEVQESLIKMRQAEGELILFAHVDALEKYLYMLHKHREVVRRVTKENTV